MAEENSTQQENQTESKSTQEESKEIQEESKEAKAKAKSTQVSVIGTLSLIIFSILNIGVTYSFMCTLSFFTIIVSPMELITIIKLSSTAYLGEISMATLIVINAMLYKLGKGIEYGVKLFISTVCLILTVGITNIIYEFFIKYDYHLSILTAYERFSIRWAYTSLTLAGVSLTLWIASGVYWLYKKHTKRM